MSQPPRVLLKYLGISLGNSKAVSMDLAVLGGTMAVLLGDKNSAAEQLAEFAAGLHTPRKGKVLTGSGMVPASSREGRQCTGYITDSVDAPPGMTARGCVNLAVASSGKERNKAGRETDELLGWLDLNTVSNVPVEELKPQEMQRTAMAVAMASSPELLVVNCAVHDSIHARLKAFARGGNAVLLRAASLGEIPLGVERIALCDKDGVVRVVRHGELLQRAMGGAEISVSFYPSLPRTQLEKIHGLKNLLHKNGKYSFTHTETVYAVTQIMNLARANSRVVAELHISPIPPGTLIKLFDAEGTREETPGGLFQEEAGF